ncbi:hypothetical protein [Aurantiacibacter rhizosphaerae]|uniref:Uncharacterized protein n=1 Tax=Aurantiacibacter rhizosphaerae TaxID=2691582 RepID=A0A844XD12_9SPHN|nr:hypothetical protein [Aurantiacibacter rhizosphaerae]MWV27498.1 hypothetical protein [Aurantiacibacter rhizosphaerae]
MTHIDLLFAASSLLAIAMLSASALMGWQGWLDLKRSELDMQRGQSDSAPDMEGGSREGMARIEIADLKERIRKLEAIANGVDL